MISMRRLRGRWRVVGSLLVGVLLLAAERLAAQQTLTVFAAASLTDAFGALGRRFGEDHPGVKVQFSFAGSQQLALQLTQGARADVFASADERWMKAVADSGLAVGEPVLFAQNRLVVVLPRSNPAAIGKLQDLARTGVKLVVGADAVPVGRYTVQMLDRLAALPGFGRDFRRLALANVASYEDNVKGIVAKVQLGEADAGVVYRSDATGPVATQLALLDVPDAANILASYPIAGVRGGQERLARDFIGLVMSAEGQRLLIQSGFMPAPSLTGASAP